MFCTHIIYNDFVLIEFLEAGEVKVGCGLGFVVKIV